MQSHQQDLQSPWLDVGQAAMYARVSKKLLYRAVSTGRLKAARVGGRRQVRLRREWLDAFIEGHVPRAHYVARRMMHAARPRLH